MPIINWLRNKIANIVDLLLETHANDGKNDENRSGQTSRRGLVAEDIHLDEICQNDVQRSGDRNFTRALDFQRFRHQHLTGETGDHYQYDLDPGKIVVRHS